MHSINKGFDLSDIKENAVPMTPEERVMDAANRLASLNFPADPPPSASRKKTSPKRPGRKRKREPAADLNSSISSTSTTASSGESTAKRAKTEPSSAPDAAEGKETAEETSNKPDHIEVEVNTAPVQPPPEQSKPPSKFKEADSLIEGIPSESLERYKRKLKTGYKLYHLAITEKTKKDRASEAPEKFVPLSPRKEHRLSEKIISKGWNALSALERKHYGDTARNMFADEEEDDSAAPTTEDEDEAATGDDLASEDDSVANGKAVKKAPEPPVVLTAAERRAQEMVGLFKNQQCCIICEEVGEIGDLLKCKGPCGNSFHSKCIKPEDMLMQPKEGEDWKCRACATGLHSCQLCDKPSNGVQGRVMLCSFKGCGRFFHPACLKENNLWPQSQFSEKALTCPAHMCHTCASDNPKDPFMKFNTKLVRCLRCPTAYHSGDHCVAAGTVQVTATQIICPKHFVSKSVGSGKKGPSTHVNANWCFICSKGGTLICCERCPAAFHAECLQIETPDGR